jgi:hypothetical protein
MSFNFKSKIIVKDINPNKMFHTYEHFVKDPKYQKFFKEQDNNECQYCKNISNNLDFGIPVYIKNTSKDSNVEIGIHGNYCSFTCSYKHFLELEENSQYKKNIKFTDSGPFFKYLSYKFFKDYNIENFKDKELDLNLYNITFKKI